MLEEIVRRIKSLPPLPESFQEVNRICNDPEGTIEQLSRVIEKDPMLVANLLKIANSPLYGFTQEIKSVSQAISLFGMNTVRALITDISVKKLLKVDMEPYGVTPEEFAHISSIQSNLVVNWYRKINPSVLDILFLSALMQETGKILIADVIMREEETYQFKSEIETSTDISAIEREFVGTTTAEVTSEVFKHWGFDKLMVKSIEYSDNYNAVEEYKEYAFALKVVKTAVPVNSPLSERSINIALKLLEKEGYDQQMFLDSIDKIREKL